MPFVKIDVPVAEIWNNLFVSKSEPATYEITDNDFPMVITEELQINNEVPDTQTVATGDIQNELENAHEHEQIPVNYVAVSKVKANESKKIESILQNCCYFVSAILVVVLIAYNIGFISYCKRKRKYLGKDPSSGLKIYGIKHKETPFLMFNKIYIDDSTENISEYIICHEACHYKHGDHLWVLIRYLVLFLNWYNPVIWAAFILSGRDCELACDEAVMKAYGSDSSKEYARTLLEMLQLQSNTTGFFALSTGMKSGYEMMKKRIIGIKRPVNNSRKALALSMAAILLFTSCSFVNTSKNAKKINADDPWYNANIIEIDTGVEAGRNTGWLYQQFIGEDDNYFVIESRGDYDYPPEDEIDWDNFDSKELRFDYIAVADRSTNQTITVIDIYNDLSVSESRIINVYYLNGKITVQTNINEKDYDPLTGALLDTRSGSEMQDNPFSDTYAIGDYEIETIVFQTENNRRYSLVKVKSPDGKISETEFNKVDKDYYVHAPMALSDTKALLPVEEGNETVYYELDLVTNELVTGDPEEYEWMNDTNYFISSVSGPEGMIYGKTENGISRLNAKIKKIEEVFNYDWCNLNRCIMEYFDLVECSQDSFILCGRYDSSSIYEGRKADKISIIELTKAEKNPHAGKTVLELFSPRGVDDVVIGEAITTFNETNGKFFIEICTRYDYNDYYDNHVYDENNDDVRAFEKFNGGSGLSNKLAIDIMNGEGPDILLNVSDFNQLSKANYLVDLSQYLKDLDSEKYFENIIEGSKTDGKLYHLPISFRIEGILTKNQNVGSSGKGFTYEEYSRFVDEVMNGKDPIFYGQPTYFAMLFNSMSDDFISDGKVDLSGPEFAKMADFVRDNVREEGTSFNAWYQSTQADGPTPNGEYTDQCTGISRYFMGAMGIVPYGNGVALAGIPSSDGRGPRFIPTCSVAVSAQAVDIKGCCEFAKLLLSDDIQMKIAMDDCFVVNRETFRKAGDKAIEYFNNGGSDRWGNNFGRKYTVDDINLVEQTILSCSKMKSEDSDISIILIEEMPPYFLGQKDLDAVIKIAQDRIQKVLDERG
ncbi:MAG: extracellular solute-binding protein [Saccharofermentans sp.]|nr:extracellular solute-binding protein [Saccharofermentans sp.]